MAKKIIFIFILITFASGANAFAQGEDLTLRIAVIGPGDELYFWWGHIALIIDDSFTGMSNFYDYGLFSFDNENFFYNFAFGRLLYSCGVSPTEWNKAGYIEKNRDITFYTLDIPPAKRNEIKEFAENNVLPENCDYFYHHFKDNCSTRIRDIIDMATDGQFFNQYGNMPGRYTLRQHVRRHTWFSPESDWFLSFLMGQDIDVPMTVWEEMFLPAEVGRRINEFWYTDSDNSRRKLVSSVETVYRAQKRPAVLDIPRKQWDRQLMFSVVLSVIFGVFYFLQTRKIRAGVVLCGFSVSICGIFFGIAGLLLYFMGIFTNHDYTYHNANMLFCSPLLLAAVPPGICYALTKDNDKRIAYDAFIRLVWLITVIGIFISMIIKLSPRYFQQNLTDQMLMLPIALLFAFNSVGLREAVQKYFKKYINRNKK